MIPVLFPERTERGIEGFFGSDLDRTAMSLIKNFATVGMATLSSRVLGFVRDAVMAMLLGSGPTADAFFVAFRLPNLFRRLFAEGAFNSAFVPLFGRALADGGIHGGERFAHEILAALLLALALMTAVGEIFTPAMVTLLAPGFGDVPDKFALTVQLAKVMFPYLACMSLTAMVAGMLQTQGRFALAAFAPTLLNITMVSAMGWIYFFHKAGGAEAAWLMSWSVFVAGILQLAAVAHGLLAMGFKVKFIRPRYTPNVHRLVTLGLPGIFSGGITQINVIVGTAIASSLPSAVSWLNYADRLYSLPLGVVGAAIGVVLLPEITKHVRAGDEVQARDALNRALEFGMFLTLPAAMALIALPQSIVHVLFERGVFGPHDTVAVANALAAYAFGLPAFVLVKIFSPAFFAREDTQTPLRFAMTAVVLDMGFSLTLFHWLGHVGVAIGMSLAGWGNAALLGFALSERGHLRFDEAIDSRLPRIVISSLIMGFALLAVDFAMKGYNHGSAAVAGPVLALECGFGVLVYFIAAQVTGAMDVRVALRMLKRRGKPAQA